MKYILWNILFVLFFFSCKEQQGTQLDDEASREIPGSAIVELETAQDLDRLLDEAGDSRFVLLGEASHGTAEYYSWRAEITKRLILEKGFTLIAVEGDWPDLYRLNQYIKGSNLYGATARQVLGQLDRWPTWMWANEEVAELGEWLRAYNQGREAEQQVGIYGLDVYSLWTSMEEVLAYLEQNDPAAALKARAALECFAPYNRDEWDYARAAAKAVSKSCADELAVVLTAMEQEIAEASAEDEALFNAYQNALVAVNAERYYTAAVGSNVLSWNIRDRHMVETVQNLLAHQVNDAPADEEPKIVIWEHNTHVGDARATDMASAGLVNVGQLLREQHSDEGVYIVGFGSYEGSVVAAPAWGVQRQVMQVPPAKKGSWEALLHSLEEEDVIIFLDKLRDNSAFTAPIGHRAIGVVYDPRSEQGNYVPSIMPARYDAFIFIDKSTALHPLDNTEAGRKEPTSLKRQLF